MSDVEHGHTGENEEKSVENLHVEGIYGLSGVFFLVLSPWWVLRALYSCTLELLISILAKVVGTHILSRKLLVWPVSEFEPEL